MGEERGFLAGREGGGAGWGGLEGCCTKGKGENGGEGSRERGVKKKKKFD